MLPPCKILRELPPSWDLCTLHHAKPGATFPYPSRFLHSAFEVRLVPPSQGGGRCVVAVRSCAVGELVLVDAPLVVASSRRELLERAFEEANDEDEVEFRGVLLSLCGDDSDREARAQSLKEGLVPAALVDRIIRHNYHVVDIPPVDGNVPEVDAVTCGLWPVGSVVNHSLHPNVTRTFVGHTVCYRLLQNLNAGDELLDNYHDPRLSYSERAKILLDVHGMRDEGPDEFDAPEDLLREIERGRAEVDRLLGEEGGVQEAFQKLAEVTARCSSCGHRDPAFTEIFRAQAEVAEQLLAGDGGSHVHLECLQAALHCLTVREPFSAVSCLLTAELLQAALDQESMQPGEAAAEWSKQAEALAREHFSRVYGPQAEIFELLNPTLSERLLLINSQHSHAAVELNGLD